MGSSHRTFLSDSRFNQILYYNVRFLNNLISQNSLYFFEHYRPQEQSKRITWFAINFIAFNFEIQNMYLCPCKSAIHMTKSDYKSHNERSFFQIFISDKNKFWKCNFLEITFDKGFFVVCCAVKRLASSVSVGSNLSATIDYIP